MSNIHKAFSELPKDYLFSGVFVTEYGQIRWWNTNNPNILENYRFGGLHNFTVSSNQQFVYCHNALSPLRFFQLLSDYPHYVGEVE